MPRYCIITYLSKDLATGQGKVREILFFFKVREKSGNFAKCQGNFKYQESQGKVSKFPNFGPKLFGCGRYFIHFE